ncbi:alpha/beta hydrolase [Modestobacter excelsi]|uniref:alpha/beta hydrolase n=1 Tax=Modestobacter excelsi TaxID=2213161 RepID=UPI00110CC6B6|nr:alpha/beta hydrolase [Modestobacter excelsi]
MNDYQVSVTAGLAYAEVDGRVLLADLYRPATQEPPPVVVFVHGGGWAVGSRSDFAETRLAPLAAHGVAVLSIDYRLVDVAHFPAQLHDVKAAVRWLRASARDLDVDAEHMGIWGASAGAVLASLVGLTAGQPELEGSVGDEHAHSSAVQAVVAWFGLSDLSATTTRSPLEAQLLPPGPEAGFLGVVSLAEVPDVRDLARQASPVTWVSEAAPPFLIAHGDRDRMVAPSESRALHDALVRVGAHSSLLVVGGAGHEDPAFDSSASLALTAGFLLGTFRSVAR